MGGGGSFVTHLAEVPNNQTILKRGSKCRSSVIKTHEDFKQGVVRVSKSAPEGCANHALTFLEHYLDN